MKIKVTDVITNYEGREMKDGKDVPITVRTAIWLALNFEDQRRRISPTDKQRCYDLTSKAYGADEINLDRDQSKFILEKAQEVLDVVIFGKLSELLNVSEKEDKK